MSKKLYLKDGVAHPVLAIAEASNEKSLSVDVDIIQSQHANRLLSKEDSKKVAYINLESESDSSEDGQEAQPEIKSDDGSE